MAYGEKAPFCKNDMHVLITAARRKLVKEEPSFRRNAKDENGVWYVKLPVFDDFFLRGRTWGEGALRIHLISEATALFRF